MKLEQSFTVTAPIEQVWSALVDVERVAPCLPGAEITGQAPDGGYEGTFTVKMGPATASYRGSLKMESLDEEARVATMSAKGTDKRGQGGATASIVSTMREEGEDTRVEVVTDFTITGRLARFGRGGMIEDISKRLMREFANCLEATLGTEPAPAAAPFTPASEPGEFSPEPAPLPPSTEEAEAAVASAAGAAAEAASAGAPDGSTTPPLAGEEPGGLDAPAAGTAASLPDEPEPSTPLPDASGAPEPADPFSGGTEPPPPVPADPFSGGTEPPPVEPAAPLPGEEAAEGSPARTAGEVDPWGPIGPSSSTPAEPESEPEAESEAPPPRTGSIPPPSAARPPVQPAKPVKGFSLLFGVLLDRIKRVFSRKRES
jgi:carbon monoxide dehydrogenase subunit G